MESPGEFLKRERELRGVTIETISSELKLSTKTIKAIEDNNEAELPHSAYVKGFIRSYCHWLGLDDNDAILRYESYLRERTEIENSKKTKESFAPKGAREDMRPVSKAGLKMTVVFAVMGLLLIVGYVVIYGGSRPGMVSDIQGVTITENEQGVPLAVEVLSPDGATPPESSAPIVVLPEPSATVGASSSEGLSGDISSATTATAIVTEALEEGSVSVDEPLVSDEKNLNVEIHASELTWVEVSLDEAPPYDITLRKDERVSLKAAKVFF